MFRKQFVFAPAALAAAVLLLLGADPSFGQKKAPADAEKLPAEQVIEKALDSPTTLEFKELPLSEVVAFLKHKHQIEIQIDQRALDDVGIDSSSPVTRNIKGVSLRSALDLMLRDLGLTYMTEDEVLLITTPDKAEERLVTKVYDVADLVVFRDEAGQRWEDYGPLLDAITATIFPQSWDQAGGPASIRAGTFGTANVLVVSQTYQGHRQVARLLEEVRKVAQKTPSEEPPLRSRPGGARRGMGGMMGGGMGAPGMSPGMGGMGGGMMGPGMGAPGMGGMGGGMMGPGMGAPGMGAKPAATPQPKKNDP